MTWQTAHPRALRVDVDAGRPTLIGSRWTRKVPAADEFDEIVIRGIHDCGNDSGGLELVVSPESFGPALTTSPESLSENYRRVDDDATAVTEALGARLNELAARATG